jgi:hypothetical protein
MPLCTTICLLRSHLYTNTIVYNHMYINITNVKVYKVIVLPPLLYVCETWTVYQRHAKKLNHFHLNCLWKNTEDQVAGQNPGHCCTLQSQPGECLHHFESISAEMGWSRSQNDWRSYTQVHIIWRIDMFCSHQRRTEEAL